MHKSEDQHRIARICKGLHTSESKKPVLSSDEFRTTTNMAEAVQMLREGSVGVAYRNETNRIVSQMVTPDQPCDVGNRLVCRRANIDGHRTKTIEYVVTAFDGERVTLDPRCASYDVVTLSKASVERHFVLPWRRPQSPGAVATGHCDFRTGFLPCGSPMDTGDPKPGFVAGLDLRRTHSSRETQECDLASRLCATIATWTWGRFDERWGRLMMPSLHWKMMMIPQMWKVDPENVHVVKWRKRSPN